MHLCFPNDDIHIIIHVLYMRSYRNMVGHEDLTFSLFHMNNATMHICARFT